MSAAQSEEGLCAASIAYPMESLGLVLADHGVETRAWMTAYRGARVDLGFRKRIAGAGHFDLYRREEGAVPRLGEIDRDGDDLSGDVLMDASMFDTLSRAYVNRAAAEVWLTLYWADPAGARVLPDDKRTLIARIGLALQPAAEAIL